MLKGKIQFGANVQTHFHWDQDTLNNCSPDDQIWGWSSLDPICLGDTLYKPLTTHKDNPEQRGKYLISYHQDHSNQGSKSELNQRLCLAEQSPNHLVNFV